MREGLHVTIVIRVPVVGCIRIRGAYPSTRLGASVPDMSNARGIRHLMLAALHYQVTEP